MRARIVTGCLPGAVGAGFLAWHQVLRTEPSGRSQPGRPAGQPVVPADRVVSSGLAYFL